MEALGFYVCVEDLEDELIRALGVASVEHVVEAQGELGSFRTLQKQSAQQGRTIEQQLRRFMGTRSYRKIRYRACSSTRWISQACLARSMSSLRMSEGWHEDPHLVRPAPGTGERGRVASVSS